MTKLQMADTKTLRSHYSWIVLCMATLVVFGSLGLARFSYSVLLPSMQKGLGMDNTFGGALATANLVGYLLFAVAGGVLAARFGPRRVIATGLTVSAISMFMTGMAHSIAEAAVWFAVAGIGSGASNVPVMGLLAAWFAPHRRGMATGIAVAGSSIAIILVGPLVPYFQVAFGDNGWRMCWFIFGGVTFVLAVGAATLLRNRPSELDQVPFGAEHEEPIPANKIPSLYWGEVFSRRIVWLVGFVYMAFGFSYIVYMTFFNKCLIAEGGYNQVEAGRLFMLIGWFSLFCGIIWGSVSDWIGRKRALAIVFLIHTVAYSLFPLWPTPSGFTISAILFGLSAWSIPGIMAATCGDLLGPRLAPAALGLVTLFLGIGQAAGPFIAGVLADATNSYWPALWLSAGVAFLGALGSLMLPLKGETQAN